jgi:hypothetical protein
VKGWPKSAIEKPQLTVLIIHSCEFDLQLGAPSYSREIYGGDYSKYCADRGNPSTKCSPYINSPTQVANFTVSLCFF